MTTTATLTPSKAITITAANYCPFQHAYCEECEAWTTTEYGDTTCPDCGTTFTDDNIPYGFDCDCIECVDDYLRDLLETHLANWDWVHIEGTNMGWQGLSGWRDMTFNELWANPREAMGINGQYRQEWSFSTDGTITVHQWHHDAPANPEVYTITGTNTPDDEEY